MAHAQQQLLDALQGLLSAGGTVAGARVFVDAIDPLQVSQLPAIELEEMGESCEPFTISGYDVRELTVQVHCIITHSATAGDQARDFGLAVEKLIAGNAPLAALCTQGLRITESRPALRGDTDRLLAARVQTWSLRYLSASDAPDIIIT